MSEQFPREPTVPDLANFTTLFHGGFILSAVDVFNAHSSPVISRIEETFARHDIDGFALCVHPDAAVTTFSREDRHAIAVGDIFDNHGGSVRDVLGDLLETRALPATLGRTDLGGRHAVILVEDGHFTVFNDPFGSRSVHYHLGEERAVSSHAVLLAELLGAKRGEQVGPYMQSEDYSRQKVRYLPGNITSWAKIRRLPPNHLFSSRFNATARYWPVEHWSESSEDVLFGHLDRAFDMLTTYLRGRYDPVLGITGGSDTRTVAAGFLARKCTFTGVTWQNFNFVDRERKVVEKICATHDIDHVYAKLDKNDVALEALEVNAHYAGGEFLAKAPRARAMQDAFSKMAPASLPKAFIIGYGGEIIRAFYAKKGRHHKAALSAGEMSQLYRYTDFSKENANFVRARFQDFRETAHMDKKSLRGFPPHDIFYWEHRMGMWGAATLDTFDPVMPALVGINSRKVFETALRLPEKRRLNKDLQMRYIAMQVPDLAAIPLI
ncbi:hypothetical protein [Pseudoponticoccus marisrubri]|nr:hypothetical protein [Pseudoponticoccus marisrubri]